MTTCPNIVYDVMDSENDVYYCNICKKYHQCNKTEQIYNAIKYLQINRLKDLFNEMTKSNLLDYKYEYKSENKSNILELTLSNLYGWSYSDDLSTNLIAFTDFNNNGAYLNNKEKKAAELYLVILDFVCSQIPELITEDIIKEMDSYRANRIVKILVNYHIEINNKSVCVICLSSHSDLIDNTCMCKNKIHLECLIEITQKLGNICKICLNNNGGIKDPMARLIFPSHDIYRAALMNRYLIAESKNSKLHFAISYLQYPRAKEILQNLTKEEYFDYYNTADYYAVHKRDKTGALLIRDMPYTNLSRDKNNSAFKAIESMLSMYHQKFTECDTVSI